MRNQIVFGANLARQFPPKRRLTEEELIDIAWCRDIYFTAPRGSVASTAAWDRVHDIMFAASMNRRS